MTQDLQLAGLSPRTRDAYVRAVRQLAAYFRTPPDRLTEQQVRDYSLHLRNDRHFAPASPGIASSGIKLFYSHTIPRDWPTLKRPRVPGAARLPDVLSGDEVRRLIAALRTPHNRTSFQAVYSLGLRLEEGLQLQVGDIDSGRMMAHIHHGRGAKDRDVPLPSSALPALRDYWATHRHPTGLFPATGRDHRRAAPADRPMELWSVQGALRRVVHELKPRMTISIHTLRHSYATHLLEAGVDLRLIRQDLGHSSLRTAMVYLHLTAASQEQARARIEGLMGR
jgi:site-specific recombinase XerD